jgi:hypothetical protein
MEKIANRTCVKVKYDEYSGKKVVFDHRGSDKKINENEINAKGFAFCVVEYTDSPKGYDLVYNHNIESNQYNNVKDFFLYKKQETKLDGVNEKKKDLEEQLETLSDVLNEKILAGNANKSDYAVIDRVKNYILKNENEKKIHENKLNFLKKTYLYSLIDFNIDCLQNYKYIYPIPENHDCKTLFDTIIDKKSTAEPFFLRFKIDDDYLYDKLKENIEENLSKYNITCTLSKEYIENITTYEYNNFKTSEANISINSIGDEYFGINDSIQQFKENLDKLYKGEDISCGNIVGIFRKSVAVGGKKISMKKIKKHTKKSKFYKKRTIKKH